MKLLVAGGRDYNREQHAFTILDLIHVFGNLGPVSLVIHGASKGIGATAAQWAEKRGVDQAECPPDDAYGKFSDRRQATDMLSLKPDMILLFPGRGASDISNRAKCRGDICVKTSDEILLEWSDSSGVFKKGELA